MMLCEIDINGYLLCDTLSTTVSIYSAPHTATDGTRPDGMRRPQFWGTYNAEFQEWINGTWIDAEAVSLSDDMRLENVKRIKGKCKELIIERVPEEKQRNYLARFNEFLLLRLDMVGLSAAEQNEMTQLRMIWDWVKAMRDVSNTAELNNTPVDAVVWPQWPLV